MNKINILSYVYDIKEIQYEIHMYLNTQTQYYNNHLHVGSIIPLK